MVFRKAEIKDLGQIMKIIKAAQKYLKKEGIDQWQNNYPNQQTIKNDIQNNNLFVLQLENKIRAAAAIIFDRDPFYDQIEGSWITQGAYGAIHRAVVAENYKGQGLMAEIFQKSYQLAKKRQVSSIRIDTHQDNSAMLNAVQKEDFKYCGIIYVRDGSKRLAYEKII